MRRMLKKGVAVILLLCTAFSACVISVSAGDVSGAIGSSLSKDLSWFGYAMVVIANTTDDEDFKESAANLNAWLCGGSNVTFMLSDISDMCHDILSELDTVNTQNKEIMSAVQELGLQAEYNAMNTAYQNQVLDIIGKYGFTNAVKFYEEYVEAVSAYKENETTVNKQAAERARDKFITSVIGANPEAEYTNCKIGGVNGSVASVDSCFYNCIADLSALLVSSDALAGNRFIDKSAQLAFKMYPFSSMQHDFVINSFKKQLLEITKIILMYQEFVGMRAEYFKGIADGSIKTAKVYTEDELDEIYETSAESFMDILETAEKRVSDWNSSRIYITSGGYWLYLNEYLTSEDAGSQPLTITNYRDSVDYNFYLSESARGRVDTSIAIDFHINPSKGMANNASIPKTVYFNKDASVVLASGSSHAQVKPFYILDGAKLPEYQTKCQIFDHNVEDFTMFYDLHLPRCDYYNMVQGVYSDGIHNYRCISSEEQLHQMLSSNYYGLCGSSVKNYFADMLGYAEGNNVYFMLNSPTRPSTQGAPTDYTVLPALDSGAQHTYTDKWVNSGIDLYNVQSDRKGEANKSNSEYTVFLLPENGDYKGKVEVEAERAEAVISGADYNPDTGLAASGEKVDICIVPDKGFEVSTLTVKLGATEKTMKKEELSQGENGEVILSCAVPYSNTLSITVNTTPEELERDKYGDYIVNDFDDLCSFAYMVNSGSDEYVNAVYVLTDDIDCMGEDFTKREMIGTKDICFNGTFDGQGHTIRNLNYGADIEGEDAGRTQGLFAVLGEKAVVKNLKVDNANVWSDDSIAKGSAVIAKQNYGTISSCKVKNSKVQLGDSDYLGGITGINNGTILYCSVEKTTLMRRWGGCGKRAMGNICEVNNGPVDGCYTLGCKFENGTITDGSSLWAVDTYFTK